MSEQRSLKEAYEHIASLLAQGWRWNDEGTELIESDDGIIRLTLDPQTNQLVMCEENVALLNWGLSKIPREDDDSSIEFGLR